MNKSAPSILRILTMVVFALSCFGLLLFLWLSFGGPIPLKPQGYRVQVAFPEAATLATEADVRIAGVSVGKVRKLAVDPTARWPRSSSTASSRRCTATPGRCSARRRCWGRPTSS
jgi:ABC-type transporter Mla subunit MlaD